MTRKEKAQKLFETANCAQATVGAFGDLPGVDERALLRQTAGLGSGVGGLQQTCGTVLGAALVLGGVYADETGANKAEVSAKVREFAKRFASRNGSLQCSELLPQANANRDPALPGRPCLRYVWSAVDLLTEMLELGAEISD